MADFLYATHIAAAERLIVCYRNTKLCFLLSHNEQRQLSPKQRLRGKKLLGGIQKL